MTKHLSGEQRRAEILEAALFEIDEKGLSNLTMEAIAARTPLSKGGVYRFFSNKRAVVLSLVKHIVDMHSSWDIDEILRWGLPLKETVMKVVFPENWGERDLKIHRVWVKILTETTNDEPLKKEVRRQQIRAVRKYSKLIKAILKRDGLRVRKGANLNLILSIGLSFYDGLLINHMLGTPARVLESHLRRFIELSINDAMI